jgi:hypothetical protein
LHKLNLKLVPIYSTTSLYASCKIIPIHHVILQQAQFCISFSSYAKSSTVYAKISCSNLHTKCMACKIERGGPRKIRLRHYPEQPRHYRTIEWRQPASTTVGKRPHLKPGKIQHVDVLAWLRRLRVAPSRTSPISTMRSRDRAFAQFAAHNHPTRRDFISARQAGTSCQRIYPAVTDPGIKPISSVGHGWRPDPPCLRQIFAGWLYLLVAGSQHADSLADRAYVACRVTSAHRTFPAFGVWNAAQGLGYLGHRVVGVHLYARVLFL